jgi:L-aminopeptidase/D-esterase-like protein
MIDVPGVRVGHATDAKLRTGVTTAVFDPPAVCGVAVHGGAPGTRETDALGPENLGPPVDAVVLSGGSAFGLAAGDGVQEALARHGRGFKVRGHSVPIVPAAIVFDLWRERPDYRALGEQSLEAALGDADWTIGTIGAGTGATTADLKGGLGAASARVGEATVGALVVVNAVGAVVAANGPWFRAAPFEQAAEFGGLVPPPDADFATVRSKLGAETGTSTVIALVATDATLTRAEARRLAVTAHDGIALSVFPAHTLYDGDTIFAASTGRAPAPASPAEVIALGAAAVTTLARAIARAVHAATPADGDPVTTWRAAFGA